MKSQYCGSRAADGATCGEAAWLETVYGELGQLLLGALTWAPSMQACHEEAGDWLWDQEGLSAGSSQEADELEEEKEEAEEEEEEEEESPRRRSANLAKLA